MDIMSVADRSWPLLQRLAGAHAWLYRTSGGRVGHNLPGLPPMLLLDHVGARSGTRRTTPLVYVADGEDVVIVASKGGYSSHPAWYHNLLANPETFVQIGPERRAVRARAAEPAERERLWPMAERTYSGYRGYRARAGRDIPLVVLEPRA
jgi:deazaflavin-dependent oxidoreductase (nitroreductase family)